MDRRTILAVFISISIYYGWLLLRGPVPGVEGEVDPATTDVPEQQAPPPPPVPTAPVRTDLPVRQIPFQACEASARWSSAGGVLQDLVLEGQEEPYEITPIWTWLVGLVTGDATTPWRPYGEDPGPARLLTPDSLALAAGSGDLGRSPPPMEVLEQSPGAVAFRGVTDEGLQVLQRARASSVDPCLIEVEVTWSNPSAAPNQGPLWVGIHDHMPAVAGGMLARYRSVERPVLMVDGGVVYGDTADMEAAELQEGPVSWFGLADRYFGFIVLPEDGSGQVWLSSRVTPEGTLYGEHYVLPAPELAAGASHTANFQVYVGPLELDQLGAVHEDLTEIVDFGWFAFFAHPLLWLLKVFHAGVQNWGLAIMLLTLLVKTIFFPLTQTAFKSSQAMQSVQPLLQEIKEKYKDNQEELNRRMMELFKEHGVNPLGGCLPMLIQFPVWIALYNVLLSSVELYHTEFLWLKDLSSADPTGILPAIVVVLMMVQQSFAPMGNLDPVQQKVMKVMPVVFGIFFFAFPSGLVVYIFVNMVLSILQQWLIKRTYESPAPAA